MRARAVGWVGLGIVCLGCSPSSGGGARTDVGRRDDERSGWGSELHRLHDGGHRRCGGTIAHRHATASRWRRRRRSARSAPAHEGAAARLELRADLLSRHARASRRHRRLQRRADDVGQAHHRVPARSVDASRQRAATSPSSFAARIRRKPSSGSKFDGTTPLTASTCRARRRRAGCPRSASTTPRRGLARHHLQLARHGGRHLRDRLRSARTSRRRRPFTFGSPRSTSPEASTTGRRRSRNVPAALRRAAGPALHHARHRAGQPVRMRRMPRCKPQGQCHCVHRGRRRQRLSRRRPDGRPLAADRSPPPMGAAHDSAMMAVSPTARASSLVQLDARLARRDERAGPRHGRSFVPRHRARRLLPGVLTRRQGDRPHALEPGRGRMVRAKRADRHSAVQRRAIRPCASHRARRDRLPFLSDVFARRKMDRVRRRRP